MTKAISAWKGYNKDVVNEANEIKYNIDKTIDMKFPSETPVLFFTPKREKETKKGRNKVSFYKTQLTNSPASKIFTLEGHHYFHWTRSKEMSREVNGFIGSFTRR
ncbi:hypothetical protein [Peribacillus kribbensis]|uniref:hypothetical protein n=1 Tax=Peribacillus kribbensis TaxID=356658 RepID=UPI000412AB26|nr:hypothetical protein [Peribacillus kribbensis]